jgi:hypothetical protein
VATNVPGSECPSHKFMAKVGLLCQRQSLPSVLFCSGCRLRLDFSFCAESMCFCELSGCLEGHRERHKHMVKAKVVLALCGHVS